MKDMHRRIVIVGGGSGGIGTEVCRLLAEKDAMVVSIRFQSSAPDKEPGIVSLKADLRSPREWERVLRIVQRRFGTPDVLINCAGVLVPGTIASLSPDLIKTVVETNVLGLLYGVRCVLPLMKEKGSGHIITIGSLGGILPMPFEALYSATKFAVRGFCLSMAEELRRSGIHSSLISVGPVATRMLKREAGDDHSEITFMTKPIAARRVAEAVLDVLLNPRTEVLLPAPAGIVATLLGIMPRLSGMCYRILRPFGKWRQNRFLKRLQESVLAEYLK